MKLELTEAWKWKKQHKSNHKKVYSLPGIVEEWDWTDYVKFWLTLASADVAKTQQRTKEFTYDIGESSDAQMSLNSNVQKSSALQSYRNDSLSSR